MVHLNRTCPLLMRNEQEEIVAAGEGVEAPQSELESYPTHLPTCDIE